MDPELMKLVQQVVSEGFQSTSLLLIGASLIAAGFGAFVGSYLKKRGETIAINNNFEEFLKQLKTQTEATKKIEASFIELNSYNQMRGQQLATKENFEEFLRQLKIQTEVTEEIIGETAKQTAMATEIIRAGVEFKERQLAEFYGPIYTLLRRIRPIDDLWTQGKVKDVEGSIIGVIRDSNNRIVDIILTKSHLIHGNPIPESYTRFLTHVAVWHAFWDDPDRDWSIYTGLLEAHYDMEFEQEIFLTTEELKRELEALYQQHGLRRPNGMRRDA